MRPSPGWRHAARPQSIRAGREDAVGPGRRPHPDTPAATSQGGERSTVMPEAMDLGSVVACALGGQGVRAGFHVQRREQTVYSRPTNPS